MFARFPRASAFVLGSASAVILAAAAGILERRPLPSSPPPQLVRQAPVAPVVVTPVEPAEPPPAVEPSPPPPPPTTRRKARSAPQPAPPPEAAPLEVSPWVKRLEAARDADALFSLAADLQKATKRISPDDANRVGACIVTFERTGSAKHLGKCVRLFEEAVRD